MISKLLRKKKNTLVTRRGYLALKRVLDTVLVLGTAPITLPIGLATGALVRINLGKPVLFKQERIGLNEETFTVFKFRSMLPEVDAYGTRLQTAERITKFGRVLRKTSLDELPQLLNVIRGDMALVGPRPLLTRYLPYYLDSERPRHSVRPGVTGAAQVSGRNFLGWDDRLAVDAKYAIEGNISDDLKIIGATIMNIFKTSDIGNPGDGADFLDIHRQYPEEDGYALRRFEYRDIPQRVEWFNHHSTLEFMRFTKEITVEGTREWLKNARKDPQRGDYSFYRVSDGQLLAVVGYRFHEYYDLPFVYVTVAPGHHGERLGSRSMKLLFEHMQNNLKLPGAAGELYRDNVRTYKLNSRLSMVEVEADIPAERVRMEVRWSK